MPRIPIDTGTPVLPQVAVADLSRVGAGQVGQGLQRAGRELGSAADVIARQEHSAEQMKDAKNIAEYESAVSETSLYVSQKIASGEMAPDEAGENWSYAIGQLRDDYAERISSANQDNFGTAHARFSRMYGDNITQAQFQARNRIGRQDFLATADAVGKTVDARVPPEVFANKIQAAGELAKSFGVQQSEVQTAIDRATFNHAQMFVSGNSGTLAGLNLALKELHDPKGRYADKLDGPNLAMLTGQIDSKIRTLQQSAQVDQYRQESRAARAVLGIEQIVMANYTPSDTELSRARELTKGTIYEADMANVMDTHTKLQGVMFGDPQSQLDFLSEREAQLAQGASLADLKTQTIVRTTIKNNIVMQTQSPLTWVERTTGSLFEPIMVEDFGSPAGLDNLRNKLTERQAALDSAGSIVGPAMRENLLKPNEADDAARALQLGTFEDRQAMLTAMRNGAPSDPVFRKIMTQVSPKSPVTTYAGLIAAQTTDRKGNPTRPGFDTASVTRTLLVGEDALNRTKEQIGVEGKAPKFKLPKDDEIVDAVTRRLGGALNGRPELLTSAVQIATTYAVGNALTGAGRSEIGTSEIRKAVDAAVGKTTDYNGRGDVLMPIGMDKSEFHRTVEPLLQSALAPARQKGFMRGVGTSGVGLMSMPSDPDTGESIYVVTVGRQPLALNGKRVVIRLP